MPEFPEEAQALESGAIETTQSATPRIQIQPLPAASAIIVFPIPADDYLLINSLSLELPISIELIDLHGRSVLKEILHPNQPKTISTTTQPAGIYFLRWYDTNRIHTVKVIINH